MSRLMPRVLLAAAGILLLSGCTKAAPAEPIPQPTHLDLSSIDVAQTDRNGIEFLTGGDALQVSVREVRASPGVVMRLAFTTYPNAESGIPGGTMSVDYSGTSGAYTAQITEGESRIDVVVVNGDAYLRADPATATARGLAPDGFSCRATSDVILDEWRAVLDPALLIETLTGASGLSTGPAIDGDPDTVNVIIDAGEGPAGAFVVSAEALPLPLRMTVGDQASVADITFTNWGVVVPVAVPGGITDACK
ncbi:hypothetical protein [Glaciibacter psychrotolerans]|uniref:LppX_LprAFG lipoprotein n=1 Tax=Glaciibacter psychrotolerans TaxID=670054 RepID=A0A7Z0J7K1_9MICO|nr:hypothetical protein [Leifsonia psychrotolerans]NYJ20959.1 hypothetical protein [Leifsonia psychrotolerans]